MTQAKCIKIADIEQHLAPIASCLDGLDACTTVLQELGTLAGGPSEPVWATDEVVDGMLSAVRMLSAYASDHVELLLDQARDHPETARPVEPWSEPGDEDLTATADMMLAVVRHGHCGPV